jgi:hypothetical protein
MWDVRANLRPPNTMSTNVISTGTTHLMALLVLIQIPTLQISVTFIENKQLMEVTVLNASRAYVHTVTCLMYVVHVSVTFLVPVLYITENTQSVFLLWAQQCVVCEKGVRSFCLCVYVHVRETILKVCKPPQNYAKKQIQTHTHRYISEVQLIAYYEGPDGE